MDCFQPNISIYIVKINSQSYTSMIVNVSVRETIRICFREYMWDLTIWRFRFSSAFDVIIISTI